MRIPGVALVALAVVSGAAHAQDPIRTLEFDDFGFMTPLTSGGRAASLGGAYAAAGNDVHCLVHNPAGLARVKRIEAAIGVYKERNELQTGYFGTSSTIDASNGSVELISVAFPVPTYRGAFTGAFGVYRTYSASLDMAYSGDNTIQGTRDNYLLQQTGSILSYNLGFGVDLAPVLSGGASVFLLDGSVEPLRQWDRTEPGPPLRSLFFSDDVAMDFSGYGARIGAQFLIVRGLQAGLSFTTPIWIRARGTGLVEQTEHVDNGIDSFSQSFGTIGTNYTLPFEVNAGVSAAYRGLLLATEVEYSDWSEASIDNRRFRNRELATIMEAVFNIRAGVEWMLPWLPLRVRGGYAYLPYPSRFLEPDRIELAELESVDVDEERHEWSAGVGGLIGRVLTLDLALVRMSGTRSVATLSHRQELQRIMISAAYRF